MALILAAGGVLRKCKDASALEIPLAPVAENDYLTAVP